jgi:UTP:GlnB (protein PII) uridylyltransferase
VSRVLLKHELNLIDARVNTLGARAEDAFVTSGAQLADAAKRESIAEELRSTAA